ncbi:MAG: FAD-dependent oxidoreductase, partial [Thermoplasmata archaeon]|nr:FAD-dependent oxidoreductase [Thermoplasmata archaeon]
RELFLKLFGKYSYGKSMPHWFLFLPTDKQAELLKGYWRGDGGRRALNFVLVTNSPKLVAQFKMLLLRLGIIPRVSRRSAEQLNKTVQLIGERRVRFRHDRFELEIGGAWLERASEIFGVRHPLLSRRTRSHAHAWIRGGYAFLPIFEVSRTPYSGEVHNIAVAGRNSYVTPGAAVHNCDGFFFKGLEVAVVGGGDTAMEESLYLSKLCKTVTVVHRRNAFRASKIMQDRLFKTPNIKVLWDSEVVDVLGDQKIEGVRIKNVKTGRTSNLKVQGLFLAIGHDPATDVVRGQLELERGYVVLRPRDGLATATSVDGVFAAGDVHDFRYRQAVTAAGFGSMAALDVERWLQQASA